MKKRSIWSLILILLLCLVYVDIPQQGQAASLAGDALKVKARFTLTPGDSSSYSGDWSTVQLPSGITYIKQSVTAGTYLEYTPNLQNTTGNAQLLVYKYADLMNADPHVQVTVQHNGKSDTFMADFSTTVDGWYSLGSFDFSGGGGESIRFTRVNTDSTQPTPGLLARLDFQYDTQTRKQTETERHQSIPIGYSETGSWQPSAEPGYEGNPGRSSLSKDATAVWNPAHTEAGINKIYVFKPNTNADDRYEIYHDGKVDTVKLKDFQAANLNEYSPAAASGWYYMGEFTFSGDGNEYVKLVKSDDGVETLADCVKFETVKFDGTIVHDSVVTMMPGSGELEPHPASTSIEQKALSAQVPPGFNYPSTLDKDISASGQLPASIYGRALYMRNTSLSATWNPLLTEPGDYQVSWYTYYLPSTGGSFTVYHNGTSSTVAVPLASLKKGEWYSLGTFAFAGGTDEEYVSQTGLNRASELLFEKKEFGGAVIKQIMVTTHPYYKHMAYPDTKGQPFENDISDMLVAGYVSPVSEMSFGAKQPMTVADYIIGVDRMLKISSTTDKEAFQTAKQAGLLLGLPMIADDTSGEKNLDQSLANRPVTREMAAQILSNAMDYSGKYMNVSNLFRDSADQILSLYHDQSAISKGARNALARALEAEFIKPANEQLLKPDAPLTRAEATVSLKSFQDNILNSGPPQDSDWEVSFDDEFNGSNVDWTKWTPESGIRYKGLVGRWAENVQVADGLLKLFNWNDNRKGVPYSSGSVNSRFKQQYGFFEAKYKYPKTYGSHSSFWSHSSGGDFNDNEGTYSNFVSNNNFFLTNSAVPGQNDGLPLRIHNFQAPDNLADSFHTYSGYVDDNKIFYGFDSNITYEVDHYSQYYGTSKNTTQVPYDFKLSTLITYFDGPLDRNTIDGTAMEADWIRVYKKTSFLPALARERSYPADAATNQPLNVMPVITFNKPMDVNSFTPEHIVVTKSGSNQALSYHLTPISAVRARIDFTEALDPKATYTITLTTDLADHLGNHPAVQDTIKFTTK